MDQRTAATHEPIIEATGLVVRKGDRAIVEVDRFVVGPGEVHVLLGPNGAGKSTLLRALNGLERCSGTLAFRGVPVRSNRDRRRLRRHTAAVFQQAYLLATTVRGNVESGLRVRGVRGEELRVRAQRAMDLFGVAHLTDRRRSGLSGGEAQRVSVARALATDPAVLFLDEPMASLDPPTRRSLAADLQRIFAELSVAVLWVTHDTVEARAMADRVTFLEHGRVVQQGTYAEVLANPETPVVAEYVHDGR